MSRRLALGLLRGSVSRWLSMVTPRMGVVRMGMLRINTPKMGVPRMGVSRESVLRRPR